MTQRSREIFVRSGPNTLWAPVVGANPQAFEKSISSSFGLFDQARTNEQEILSKIIYPNDWGGTVHDLTWVQGLSAGSTANYVSPAGTGTGDPPTFSIAAGAGPSGEDCLAVTQGASSTWLPGLWIIPAKTSSGARPTTWDTAHMVAPYNANIVKIRMLCKWPTDFRAVAAAAPPPGGRNLDFGTYIATEAGIQAGAVESFNWHFYNRPWIRHDLGNGEWFVIDMGIKPNAQRTGNGSYINQTGANPIRRSPGGNALATAHTPGDAYCGLLTRMYVEPRPYGADPEISKPFSWLIAGVWGIEATRVPYYTITPDGFTDQGEFVLDNPDTMSWDFDIQEALGVEDDCYFTVNARYQMRAQLRDTSDVQLTNPLHFTAGETKTLRLYSAPDPSGGQTWGTSAPISVSFIPARRYENESTYVNRSDSDANVENRVYPTDGKFDEINHADIGVWITAS